MAARKSIRLLASIAVLGFLVSGCGLFRPRDKPLDMTKEMPKVSVVIQSVQEAIDATAGEGWGESKDSIAAGKICTADRNKAKEACAKAYTDAQVRCRKESGATASTLCSDFLRDASAKCGPPGRQPDSCAVADSYAPMQIKSVTFKFSAASSSNAGGEFTLWLVSGKATRKAGRTSSFVIEMAPREPVQIENASLNAAAEQNLASNLEAVLRVALDASNHCSSSTGPKSVDQPKDCFVVGTPQLAFQKATYTLELDYVKSASAGFEWSVSPIKISASGGSEQTLGNTLVVELER